MAIALAPLLFASLSAPWCPHATATDASDIGLGVVATHLPDSVMADLARERPPVATPDHPIPRTLDHRLSDAKWSTIVASRWQWLEHINVLEARALTVGVRWALSFPESTGSRLLTFCDSLVVVHAVRKGRSSSFPLLRALRQLSALLLAGGLQLSVNYIATEVNPADGPSRRASSWIRDLTAILPRRALSPTLARARIFF